MYHRRYNNLQPNGKEHYEHLEKIFKTLVEANMKVQLEKCNFFQNEIEFLGYMITSKGIKTNPSKVEFKI